MFWHYVYLFDLKCFSEKQFRSSDVFMGYISGGLEELVMSFLMFEAKGICNFVVGNIARRMDGRYYFPRTGCTLVNQLKMSSRAPMHI